MGKALYYTCAMMNRTLVKHVLDSEVEMPDVLIQGWVRTPVSYTHLTLPTKLEV